ncbi:MAG: ABC transporter substrate-binding protein, partial [Candidatus Carbobacillus sp.]|nr:ABC transporter substrate-binding protein [Candidatus Carbobacillus sp.]
MRKLWFAAMVFVLVAGLSACGGGSTTGSADKIKVGLNMELSGNVASYGESGANGAILAADEINAKGGIDGKKIEIVKFDNRSDASESTNGALRLMQQDKVSAIIGSATSNNTKA